MYIRKLSAFSIPEVVLSAFVLTTGIISVMSLFSAAHRGSFDTRNVIIASELAQEGVEVARNIRDNNTAYRVENWTTGDNCQASMAGNCDPFRYFPNGGNSRCSLNYNSAGSSAFTCPITQTWINTSNTGLYHQAGGTATRFFRIIKIDHTGGSSTARIQSFVSWRDPGSNLNSNGATAWCTPYNQCVYTELLLSTWK
jgi:Tfp pilus assembly protein PilV